MKHLLSAVLVILAAWPVAALGQIIPRDNPDVSSFDLGNSRGDIVIPIGAENTAGLPVAPLFATAAMSVNTSAVAVAGQSAADSGALFFDGVNDYVTFGNNPALGLKSFTLELWFRREGAGVATSSGSGGIAAVPLITKGRGESDGSNVDCNYYFGIEGSSGKLAADFEDMATGANHPIVGKTVIPSGVWQHAAVTFDATKFEWRLYLNGNLEAVGTTVRQIPRFDSIQHSALGSALNSTGVSAGAFFGLMDEVRIWNYARSQVEIQQSASLQLPSAPGLVARWACNESSGTVVSSTAALPVTGTLTNGVTWTTGAPMYPPSNTAMRFDGVDDYLTMGVAPELGLGGLPSNGLTIECWFRREGSGVVAGSGSGGVKGVPLFGKGRGENDGSTIDCDYFFGIDAAGHLVADFETYPAAGLSSGQNYPVIATHDPIKNGIWYHAAAMYDGASATWKLYLNGVQVGSATTAPGSRPRFDSIQHFAIATAMNSLGVPEGAFAGSIDEVRLWNIVRTPAQILDGKDREIASAPGLVARYGLNEATGLSVKNSVGVSGSPIGTVVGNPMWVDGATFPTTNPPPQIMLDSPAAGATSRYPLAVTFSASASGPNSSVSRVEFYVDGNKVGAAANAPYTYAWTPPAIGTYSVVARLIDNLGATQTSAAVALSITPNANQPAAATLLRPGNQESGVNNSTLLRVNITDQENDPVTVTFYGRKTVPPTPGPDFTIVTLPDTQFYSENMGGNRFRHYLAQTNWIVSQRDARNIVFVTHMGDIVDDGDSIPQEWINANQAMTILEDHATTLRAYGIPFGAAPGNHDQATNGNPSSPSSYYNQYFGVSRYAGRPYWGGNYGANNDNNYQLFSASGLDFIILHLEYRTAADPAVIAWADSLLKAYPHRRAIVTSHWIIGQGHPARFGGQGQQIYDGLKNNPNLFLLLCGHIHAEGRRDDVFDGRTVYSLLQDYQGATEGGNGFLRYLTFSPANNVITAVSYSPSLDRAPNTSDNIPGLEGNATLAYDMQHSVSDWIPLGSVSLPPGVAAAELNWTGLEKSSHYEWRVETFDSNSRFVSSARRFSTAAAFAPVITLSSPIAETSYTTAAAVTLRANASDADGGVSRVEFFLGTTKLGEDSTPPYELTAPRQPAGKYTFSAIAIDNDKRASPPALATVTVVDRINGTSTRTASTSENDHVDTNSPVAEKILFSAAGAMADPDGDLIPALAEYALGTSLTTPNRSGLPVLGNQNGQLTLTFLRARSEITYTVQASDDLTSWTDLSINPGAVGEMVTTLDANTTSPNRFLRLRLSVDGNVVATVPIGRMTYTFTANQEVPLNFPLTGFLDEITGQPAGFITGLAWSVLENEKAGWSTGQLSQPQSPYLVRITSGAAKGRIFPVVTADGQQNTSTRLNLVTAGVDLTGLGIVPGVDTYELLPADTLSSLFPVGALLSGNISTADTLRIDNGDTWTTYFHDGSGWRRQDGDRADNRVLTPYDSALLLRRGATTSFVIFGQVSLPATIGSP